MARAAHWRWAIVVTAWMSLAWACASEPAQTEPPLQPVAEATKAEATPPRPPVDDGPPVRLYASKYVSKIRSAPSKDAPRIGYLRGGAVLSAKTSKPLGFEACRKGWFELETGGFVCSTTDVISFTGTRLPDRRPTQPVFDKPLPYPYGYARTKGTPVYKRLPTDEEAALYEGYKIPGAPPPSADGGVAPAADPAPAAASGTEAPPATEAIPAPQAAGAPGTGEEVDPNAPPTLASLMGDGLGVLIRRMERGFYVSLDREINKGPRWYWQTQAAGYIPKSRLYLVDGSDFHGVDLSATGLALPLGFMLTKKSQAFTLDDKGRLRGAGKPEYHFMFPVASDVEIKGRRYFVAPDGRHYPARDAVRVMQRERPKDVLADEKWIDVDLETQSLVAYVGDTPVYVTLVSTGRVKDPLDPLKNFETPVGAFRIASKHVTATMDGDHSVDGPYSIEDVPYVMYFQLAYALHSAFWHNSFGRPRSHGCINLAPADAKWLFEWAAPERPKSWHGVYPGEQNPGTRLYTRGKTPEG
jgi:L,D-transpeptidase catalytic domain